MRLVLSLIMSLISLSGLCQLAELTIPDSLKENANEVVMFDNSIFSIKDIDNSMLSRHYKAVIMNSKASDRNSIYIPYDDFTRIEDANVKVYSMMGKEIEHFKLKDFQDFSTKGSSVASSGRVKLLNVISSKYPYMIEVYYELSYKGSLFYPSWMPQGDENQSVVYASLEIKSLEEAYRFKSFNVDDPVSNPTSSKWEIHNRKAFVFEPYSPGLKAYAPVVYTAPNDFQMDGLVGNMSSWKNLGLWQHELMIGRNTLTPEQLDEVQKTIPENASKLEKVKLVYKYLQDNTRYVSVQLGIGGWKPFESGFVHDKKYGDCKALSFYTKSILESLGIDAYYTLIYAGNNPRDLYDDFPARIFNHVIVTIPMENDTIWLECTNQTNPFGYLGTFTSNRKALMITPDGGKVIQTKTYTPKENLQATISEVKIEKDGSANVKLTRQYSGLEIDNSGFSYASKLSEKELQEWFYDRHGWGNLQLNSIKITEPTQEVTPKGTMKVNLHINQMASSNANRLFYQPTIFTDINWMDIPSKSRTVDLEIRYSFTQKDTLKVTFPEGYSEESMIKDEIIANKYGRFERIIKDNQGEYIIIREFQLNQGLYPSEEYENFRSFIKDVQKLDRQKIVMLNKT